MMKTWLIGIASTLGCALILFSATVSQAGHTRAFLSPTDTLADAYRLYRQAMQHYKEKNYETSLQSLQQAYRLRPNSPLLTYQLAAVHSLLGHADEAIRFLTQVAKAGMYFEVSTNKDFKDLQQNKKFKQVLNQFNNNKKPLIQSQLAYSLPERDLITEGIAYRMQDSTFYVSSVHKRKIIRIDKNGQVFDFSSTADHLWSVQSLQVDASERYLWASSTAYPQMEGYRPADAGRTAIFKYDLHSGKLAKRYLPSDTLAHGLGDLRISPQGQVYASDQSGAIYRISPHKDSLEVWFPVGTFASPQGIDFSSDGQYMFVADYAKGIFRVNMATRQAGVLPTPTNTCLLGIDGLYFYRNSLIAIQNGTSPARLLRLSLQPNLSGIARVDVVEANHPLWNEPTLGVVVRDEFYYIANSQWGVFNEETSQFPLDKLQSPSILKIKL